MTFTKKTIQIILNSKISKSHLNFFMKRHYPRIHKQIHQQTLFLDKFENEKKKISIFERLYCIEHNLSDRPKCQTCHKNYVRSFIGQIYRYSKWCCTSCQASDLECIEKAKKTNIERYGDPNFNNSEKSKQTLKQKLKDDPNYLKKRGQKIANTKFERYGDRGYYDKDKAKETLNQHIKENPNFWYEREQKSKQTKIKNGHDGNWNNREKYHQTCIEKFGVFSYPQSLEFKEKTKKTIDQIPDFYEKRNEKTKKTIDQIPDFYEKRNEKTKKTCNKRYGVDFWLQTKDCRQRNYKSIIREKMKILNECEYDLPFFSYDFLLEHNLDKTFRYQFKCKKCGRIFTSRLILTHGKHYHCPKCYPRCFSKCERSILEYIKQIWINQNEIFYHDRKEICPLEIDILIKNNSMKFGIEYNGIYWHSIDQKTKKIDKNYHFNKTTLCEEKNIKLFSIFEDEYILNPLKVEDKIAKFLGVCQHIDGKSCIMQKNASSLCLIKSNEVVAELVFSKSRFNIKEEWEFISYETKKGIIVDDGLKILTDSFIQEFKPKSIVTFIDRSYSIEEEFLKVGFKIVNVLKPTCWWIFKKDFSFKYHNLEFKKNIASTILNEEFKNTPQQIQKLIESNWIRIYDCGYIKMIKVI